MISILLNLLDILLGFPLMELSAAANNMNLCLLLNAIFHFHETISPAIFFSLNGPLQSFLLNHCPLSSLYILEILKNQMRSWPFLLNSLH
jgi:hypothetical protein